MNKKDLALALASSVSLLSASGCTDTGELHPFAATVIAVGGGVAIAKEQQRQDAARARQRSAEIAASVERARRNTGPGFPQPAGSGQGCGGQPCGAASCAIQ